MKSRAMSLIVYAPLALSGVATFLLYGTAAHLLSGVAAAQDASAAKTVYATVTKIDPAAHEMVVKVDQGGEIAVTLAQKVNLRKVAFGEKDLRNAATIQFTDIAVGDRVMARGIPSGDQKIAANLIVVMSQSDVAKKQEADRADWEKRGVNGIVTAVNADSIILNVRTLAGAKSIQVAPAANAVVRRYTADSIKFSDAKDATFAEIKTGDQVRARGEKSEDGLKMTADEIVSGAFKTIAATVVSIDAAENRITVKDLDSKKTVTVKVNADSNMKRLPDQMAQMIARRVHPENFQGGRGGDGGSMRGGGGPPAGGPPGGGDGGGMRAGGGPPGGGGRGGDLQQMLDRLPPITLADLKVGEPIVISSPVANADHITAITMLAGVEPILRSPGKPEMSLGGWSLGGGGEMGGGN